MGSLKIPKINERQYDEILASAIKFIKQNNSQWTDLTPGDPGVVLLEAFAHMTELMIERLNILPYKAYIEFLAMIGVKLQPPVAAQTELTIKLSASRSKEQIILKGTRVSGKRSDSYDNPPIFITTRDAIIKPGNKETTVQASHCQWIKDEFAGYTSGQPGFYIKTANAPIVAPIFGMETLVVAIEISDSHKIHPRQRIKISDKEFGIWTEVEDFSRVDKKDFVYIVDRVAGIIQFSPAYRHYIDGNDVNNKMEDITRPDSLLPPEGMEIRLSYCYGGGKTGNVAKGFLQVFKDSNSGLTVKNSTAAVGGRDVETLQNALLRGPQQLNSLKRAVTARDFELLAIQSSGAVSRTRAYTKSSLWRHAKPGTVGVLLVPELNVAVGEEQEINLDYLMSLQSDQILRNTQNVLDEKKPLGIICEVNWVHYKSVFITGKIIINENENSQKVRQRVINSLYRTICPKMLCETDKDWNFGQSLKSWDVYKIIASEPGVVSVEQLKLNATYAPQTSSKALAVDNYQPDTWYTSSGNALFRTVNNGKGWEKINEFDSKISKILPFPLKATSISQNSGLLAVVTEHEEKTDQIHISPDCGESWNDKLALKFNHINDIAWLEKNSGPNLLIATNDALYQYAIISGTVPIKILVDLDNHNLKIDRISIIQEGNDGGLVTVYSSKERGQVYLSNNGAAENSFKKFKTTPWSPGEVSSIIMQKRGPHHYLWVLLNKMPNQTGNACYRRHVSLTGEDHEGWIKLSEGWEAGNCYSLAFSDSLVFSASENHGILVMDMDKKIPEWIKVTRDNKLDLEAVSRLGEPKQIVADQKNNLIMVAGEKGVFFSKDKAKTFENCSKSYYSDEITLPKNWLFCSSEHEIEVELEMETENGTF